MRDIGKGAAVNEDRIVLQCLDQVRFQRVLQQCRHGTLCLQIRCRHRLVVIGITDNDPGQPCLQIIDIRRQAEYGHDLTGHGDIKTVLTRNALHPSAEAVHDMTELAVIHVHASLPRDALRVDAERIALLDVIVKHGGEQVVGRADGVNITGEMQVDVFHRDDLCVTTAGCTALDTEYRTE